MSENKKYRLTDEFKMMDDGTKVFRIEAMSDFGLRYSSTYGVSSGELGGFVESEDNLSFGPDDDSWVWDEAVVKGNARLERHSEISDDVLVEGNSLVTNRSEIEGSAVITDSLLDHCDVNVSKIQNSSLKESGLFGDNDIIDSDIYKSVVNYSDVINSTFENAVASVDSSLGVDYADNKITNTKVVNSKIGKGNVITNSSVIDTGVGDERTIVDEDVDRYPYRIGGPLSDRDRSMISWREDSWAGIPDEVGDQKYRLTDETITHEGVTLHRIQAVQDIPFDYDIHYNPIVKGTLGGFVESESNLSNIAEDQSWIYDGAIVKGDSKVTNQSLIHDGSVIEDSIADDGAYIVDSHVVNSEVRNYGAMMGAKIYDSEIDNSTLYTNESALMLKSKGEPGPTVRDSKVIDGSRINNSCVVENSLINFSKIGLGSKVVDSEIEYYGVPEKSNLKGARYYRNEIIEEGVSVDHEKEVNLVLSEDDLKGLDNTDTLEI